MTMRLMNNAIAKHDPMQNLLSAVDALAAAEAAYLADEISHREYRAAVDAVAQARDAAGLQDFRLTRAEAA